MHLARLLCLVGLLVSSAAVPSARADHRVVVDVNRGEKATTNHRFESVPAPSDSDAGNLATVSIISGSVDGNGASSTSLVDGQLPRHADDPSRNFFFIGATGGRVLLDLGKEIDIQQVNTYSWHPDVRGPQVYTLFAAGEDQEVDLRPRRRRDLQQAGWTQVAEVDTRSDGRATGGQYGVSIRGADEGERLGRYRYLLLDIAPTEPNQRMSQTFYSEIDVIDGNRYPAPERIEHIESLQIGDQYTIDFDTTELPEIRPWVNETLKPICAEWYPRIVQMLPSENFEAPKRFTIIFHKDTDGVAYATGTEIHCSGPWYMRNLDGEAAGSVVHEMVHIVQQYRGRRGANRNPGWLVEGVADYVRWFLYEPEENRPRVDPRRANYDDSYRTSAAFLNYVVQEHDPQLIQKLNAAMRRGEYREPLWVEYTGKTPAQLWEEFVKTL